MICSPPSDITFSQVREDPAIELQVIQRLHQSQERPLRVLIVASGGCTALSLLGSPAIAHIDAVDANPAQLHLVELRRQALATLPLQEQFHLLGIQQLPITGEATPPDRLMLYNKVRSHLSEATRLYWDTHIDQLAFGVNQVGRFEQLFRELSAQFAAIGLNPLECPAAAIAHPQWCPIFEAVFERHKLANTFGEVAVNYSMDRSFGEHFADVFAQALARFSPTANYFLTQVWSDRYAPSSGGIPLYLQPTVQQSIQQLGTERLHLHHGLFLDTLLELTKTNQFDLIQFSNISDWMPVPKLHCMIESAVQCLKPGGAMIGRRLNGDHHLATIMAKYLAVDQDFSRFLLESDRSFFYQEVVVGFHPMVPT
ncbi:DUF3419 family protein [Leptolyngbya sp. FACHB-16]|uniref:DUF3419 family protein n=1 Tax=unclassified Leptolyngbya TaxID=2650499 RepID=UPI001687C36A|nr:DUF3419 family protein [Leptolyngbya sp. FACHB-16]